MSKFILI